MISLQKSINQELEKAPIKLAKKLIAKKLSSAGVSAPDEVASKLLEHTLSGNKEKFFWNDGKTPSQEIDIHITDEDFAEIEGKFQKFSEEDHQRYLKTFQSNRQPQF
jgi:hypothetical protein